MRKLLVANRGEIACRVMRSCASRGIGTVAIYSAVDEGCFHTRLADESVFLGGVGGEGYLRGDSILEIAKARGCDGIHPGYGFLSENEEFADLVEEAGLEWVGPPSGAIKLMGDKIESRKCALSAGVPVVPGSSGVDEVHVKEEAGKIGYPLLIKASAGGGGRGMRLVEREEDVEVLYGEAVRESEGAFGDGSVFLERYIRSSRHVEVQVVGDKGGDVMAWGVRECSLQRRHQKVIEEAPSLAVRDSVVTRMSESAVMLAREVGYFSAGTVEFIVDDAGEYYFLEMNTRLQVEHPVTEEVYGVDLVGLMLDVAEGKRLKDMGYSQGGVKADGWCFEARICAEDAIRGFIPSFGVLDRCVFPEERRDDEVRVRVDTGVEEGDSISMYYDTMVAKLIVWSRDRDRALSELKKALDSTVLRGVNVNVGFLSRLLTLDAVREGKMTTDTIGDVLSGDVLLSCGEDLRVAFFGATLKVLEGRERRMGRDCPTRYGLRWKIGGEDLGGDTGISVEDVDGELKRMMWGGIGGEYAYGCEVGGRWDLGEVLLRVDVEGKEWVFRVSEEGEYWKLEHCGWEMEFVLIPERACGVLKYMIEREEEEEECFVISPIPGVVKKVMVREGEEVEEGMVVCVVEAMKMENSLRTEKRGRVKEVYVHEGETIGRDHKLVWVE